MIAIVAWSAWPLVRPARTIEIEQAIIASTSELDEQSLSPSTQPARSTRMVQAAGWLEAEPYFVAATALTDGVIEEMLVLEGDRAGVEPPTDAYEVVSSDEPRKDAPRKLRFLIAGSLYKDWENVPAQYKTPLPPPGTDPDRTSGAPMFKIKF